MFKLIPSIILVFLFTIPLINLVSAQGPSFDATYSYLSIQEDVQEGDIVMNSDNGLILANLTYTNKMFGVVQEESVIVYRDVDNQGTPVSRSGIAEVNVTTLNGPIKQGDYITSSPIAGKGMKATQSGYVLGSALEDFSGEGGQSVSIQGATAISGKIKVALRIEYAEIDTTRNINRLLEYLNAAIFKNIQNPESFIQIIRYVSAGLIMMTSFAISFLIFSRTVAKGVEGIGRNPLAKNAIQFSMMVSAALTVAIVLIGIVASFVIIRF